MQKHFSKKTMLLITLAVIVILSTTIIYLFLQSERLSAPKQTTTTNIQPKEGSEAQETQTAEVYKGEAVVVADTFSVKVPNGWKASVADTGNFKAIMFALPEQLNTLKYDADTKPIIDRSGIPSWDGLTEHFYIRYVQPNQQFDPTNHREVSSKPFTFDDGTIGVRYLVIKHAEEAKQYGGLLRDDEWQGRTYIYEKSGKRVDMHLALYPSSKLDRDFYEAVVRSVNVF